MKVMSIVGARPQFIKAAMVNRALRQGSVDDILIHTGQHYDDNMSKLFFDEMEIPRPSHNLGVGSGSHAVQTGTGLMKLEPLCADIRPDFVLVFGDTNATLTGALVGAKIGIPVAHVEAGLRSGDRSMPEEINRIVADRLSDLLFCPTDTAVKNLAAEGMTSGVHNVGDVMYDAAVHFGQLAAERSAVLDSLSLSSGNFVLATIHRDFNTDDGGRLRAITDGLLRLGRTVVFPAHPRVRKRLAEEELLAALENSESVRITEPVGYLDMVALEKNAAVIVTDSGGVQKEAFFHGVPCVTIRPSTEWVETVEAGWNRLVDADADAIAGAVGAARPPEGSFSAKSYGSGSSAKLIAGILKGACRREAQ